MPLGGAVIAGAGLLYSGIKGAVNDSKASAIQKNLKDPVFHIPDEFIQNRNLARQMAQIGLPQQQYNNQLNNINQNQAQGIAAINNSANPGAGIAATVRAGDNATNTLNAEDAQARANNQRYFISQNGVLGQQELAKQQNDVYDKYTRDFNQMQAYRGAANQNYNNAINGAQNLGLTYMNSQNGNDSTPAPQGYTPQTVAQTTAGFNQYLQGQRRPSGQQYYGRQGALPPMGNWYDNWEQGGAY